MIKLIELNDIRLAQMLADYLQLQGIPCQLQSSETGSAIFLTDEQKLVQAESEIQRFIREPHHARYRDAAWQQEKNSQLAFTGRFFVADRSDVAGTTTDTDCLVTDTGRIFAVLAGYSGRASAVV